MPLPRAVVPELLDELPPSHPEAVKSRKDLRRINQIMRHQRVFEHLLVEAGAGKEFQQLVELGAGDGTFMLSLGRRLSSRLGKLRLVLMDRQQLVTRATLEGFEELGWEVKLTHGDVFEWLESTRPVEKQGFMANLFLHHFTEKELARMLRLIAERSVFFAACDPRRSMAGLMGSRLLALIGCNAVTRHDAAISVRAGFKGRELSELWPGEGGWKLQENETGLFSHTFSAMRT